MKKKILTIMAGLPRSGKSTWVKENCRDKFIVSADNIRKIIHGMDYFAPAEQLVWTIRHYILINALEQGYSIAVDETNLNIKKRMPIIKLAEEYGYITDCIYLKTEIYTCIKRASENKVLIKVIEKMNKYKEEPTLEEGFSKITVI